MPPDFPIGLILTVENETMMMSIYCGLKFIIKGKGVTKREMCDYEFLLSNGMPYTAC